MSVSLVVFRLELDHDCSDDHASFSHLHYVAPKLKRASMSTAVKSPLNQESKSEENIPENSVCRGTRVFHEIQIETFEETGKNSDKKPSQLSSKESSPVSSDLSGKSKDLKKDLSFVSGNPFVEVTKGILHLYKENEMTCLEDEVERSEMICILAVPTAMTSHDLLQFTAPVSPEIEHMRIVRDSTPNQYMVLIKFRSQESADLFYKNFDGVRFNSIEPEVCHLVYVAKVETTKDPDTGSLPIPGHTELPTCPVCLERMDESVDGILTILCNHSFHGSCLSKWGDTSCPVCRYCQTPEASPDNKCFECHSQESLWICLICGYVGCGRYVEGHAYTHFRATQHTYSMQLYNNRVWDYAGDNYVHRLVQNKSDGKLVEWDESGRNQVDSDEKMDSIQLEYTYLLTNQLESQRRYFEEKMMILEKEAHREMEELKERTMQAVEKAATFEQKLMNTNKEKVSQEKKSSQANSKLTKVINDLKEEREINKCLRQNQQMWNNKVKDLEKELKQTKDSKEKEIADLKDQLRDIMFYLEAQTEITKTPSETQQEILEGQIVVGATAPSTSYSKHRKKKK